MMKKAILFSTFFLAGFLSAQKTHTVVKGDTPYNISKKYGMSIEELYKLNPNVKNGNLQLGESLVVSGKNSVIKEKTETKATPVSKELGKIILKPKQTHYSITKQYHISFEELKKYNPDLDNLTKIGDEISLPLSLIKKYRDAEATTPVKTTAENSSPSTPIPDNENTYTVKEKDNYFRITKAVGINKEQLFALNPGLEEKGLHPGDVLRVKGNTAVKTIPKTQTPEVQDAQATVKSVASNQSTDDYITYTVQNGDTVFGILNRFGITLDELMSLNPGLSDGLKPGMVLKIKKADAAYSKKKEGTLNIVIMLPFGYDSNNTKFRSLSTDFLLGAKLAIERNTRNGLPMSIKVVDVGNENNFKQALTQINKDNTDLIIGPFLKSNVIEVADFVGSSKIPVVAPFANSEEMYDYSNLIIVGTNDQVYADKITQEVKEVYSDQKIYVVAGNGDQTIPNYLKNALKKNIKDAIITLVNSPSEMALDQNMMTGKPAPVIAILATDDAKTGEDFGNKVIELGKTAEGVKAFSLYYNPFFDKKVDDLSAVNLVYLMDRKINTEGSFEIEVLKDFKQKYCVTPSKYSVIGFDVINDILSRENKKGELLKNMSKSQTQLATKFDYERVKKGGAYVNKGYRVVRLLP